MRMLFKGTLLAMRDEHEFVNIRKDKRPLGIILTLIGFLLYAFYTILFEIASKQHNAIQTATSVCIQFAIFHLFMLICFFPLCLLQGKEFFKCRHPKLIVLRTLLSITSVFFYSLARVWTDKIDNSMLYSTDGLWVILILIVLNVKIDKLAVLGAWIGAAGIFFIYFFDINSVQDLVGGAFGTLSGITLAIVLFLTSYMVKRDPALRIGFYHSLIGLTLYTVLSVAFGVITRWTIPDMNCIIMMMLSGFFFALILFCWIEAFSYTEVYIIGATSLAFPVFTESINWVLTQNPVPWSTVVGVLILTIGGVLTIASSYLKHNQSLF